MISKLFFIIAIAIGASCAQNIDMKKVAHHYGWPSAVNGAGGDVNLAAAVYKDYDVVVWGAGIEDPSHGDNANAAAIIAHADMANTEVYGYVDATLPLVDIQTSIDNWYNIGVAGIFVDQFGYDFGVSRHKQNEIVWCIHEKGPGALKAYVNAWDPDHVFSSAVDATHNPDGDAPRLESGDICMLESYQIINGAYQTETDWRSRSNKVAGHLPSFSGVEIYAVTTNDASAFDQNKADYSYFSALADGFHGWGWGEENFGASGSSADSLPYRTRKEYYGTKYDGAFSNVGGSQYERQTNVGFHIDASTNTVTHLLN